MAYRVYKYEVTQRVKVAVTIAVLLTLFAFLSALLPLCVDLDHVQSTMIVFSVIIALGYLLIYVKSKPLSTVISPILLFGFIAAVIGATVNIPTNPGAYGYEIFSVVIISILSIASYAVIAKLVNTRPTYVVSGGQTTRYGSYAL